MITRKINLIVWHCSDSDHAHHNDIMVIDQWHKERGFNSESGIHCGYHFFIQRSGKIQEGRPISEKGAHAKGYNSNSIGICLHGKETFTEAQFESLILLTKTLLKMLPESKIIGHCDVSNKTCPNFKVDPIREKVLS